MQISSKTTLIGICVDYRLRFPELIINPHLTRVECRGGYSSRYWHHLSTVEAPRERISTCPRFFNTCSSHVGFYRGSPRKRPQDDELQNRHCFRHSVPMVSVLTATHCSNVM